MMVLAVNGNVRLPVSLGAGGVCVTVSTSFKWSWKRVHAGTGLNKLKNTKSSNLLGGKRTINTILSHI